MTAFVAVLGAVSTHFLSGAGGSASISDEQLNHWLGWGIAGMGWLMTMIMIPLAAQVDTAVTYVVTDRRVLRVREVAAGSGRWGDRPAFQRVVARPLNDLKNARLRDFGNGYGTILTGLSDVRALYCIRDASAVYRAIMDPSTANVLDHAPVPAPVRAGPSAVRGLLPLGLFGTIGLAVVIYGVASQPGAIREKNDYDHAPGCVASGAKDASLPGCTTLAAPVVDKSESSGRGGSTYYLTVQLPDGSRPEVTLPGHRFYDAVVVGMKVDVQLWKGHIRTVGSGGFTVPTADDPDYWPAHSQGLVFGGMVLLAMSALMTFLLARARPARIDARTGSV